MCFHAEAGFQYYLHYLKISAEQFGFAVHAYGPMTNHVHLLLTPDVESSAGLMMKNLGQHNVHYFNRRYRCSGTLWEGRFRTCLTQTEGYVPAWQRYIELDSVRPGMVTTSQHYRESRHHANGLAKPNAILTPHAEYTRLVSADGNRQQANRALFRAYVDEVLIGENRSAPNGNSALCSERVQIQIEAAPGRCGARHGGPATEGGAGRRRAAALDVSNTGPLPIARGSRVAYRPGSRMPIVVWSGMPCKRHSMGLPAWYA